MTTYSKFKKLLLFPAIFLIMFCITAVAAEKKPVTKPAPKDAAAPTTPAAPATPTLQDPNNPLNPIYLDSKGGTAGTGDIKKSGIASADAKVGAGWHPAALASTNLPMDKYGLIDWAKVVQAKNVISPRFSLDPAAKPDDETILDMNILFETKSNFMDNVVFPHYMHSWWLKCEACHQSVGGPIFEMGAGANKVKMVEMSNGKWCGRCHGLVAFPLADCRRCHTWPKAKKPDETMTLRSIQQ
jgi:c(7)-type cytochrome triheme protein